MSSSNKNAAPSSAPVARAPPRRTPPVPPSLRLPRSGPAQEVPLNIKPSEDIGYVTGLLKKRRAAVYAVGFAVVVVAGSLLGFRLKEAKQDRDKRIEIFNKTGLINGDGEPSISTGTGLSGALSSSSSQGSKEAATTAADRGSTIIDSTGIVDDLNIDTQGGSRMKVEKRERGQSPYALDIAQQIALLEDRRAILIRSKANFEKKIEMLHRRKAQREEEEAKRDAERRQYT